ncbi:ribonuclease H-like domain-containing protein [Heyndrickxia sp. NPDC080065]|uniref:ribonuclease H-like domain-containing protein n=1 Tax=Heyndrickxia sp. NPDC080065 TaxID=3390568 RepID=UPI003D04E376
MKNKLQRFKNHLGHKEVSSDFSNQLPKLKKSNEEVPFLDVWKKANTTTYYLENEYCLIREVHYPMEHLHGRYQFQDFLTAIEMWNKEPVQHPLSSYNYHPEDLFFFDTETTGLGGGAGNTIFLLGYACVKNNEIVLRQHILPEPGLEIPLYYSFLESIDYTTLVTYNGKAFDWPQVKTRHTLIREHVPKLPSFGHFDLYHASRRLWKEQLPSVKLVNIEKEILHFERKDDVPGFLAPMIYFDYVERKNPEGMINVLKHNENDILSLITLYTHLSFQILQKDPNQTSHEKVQLGKWFHYIGEKRAAFETFEVAANENDIEAKHELAFHLKKQKKFSEAKSLWLDVVKGGNNRFKKQACIEIAKILEHQFKDYELAKEYTKKALTIHGIDQQNIPRSKDKFLQEAVKRLERLKRK